MSEQEQQNQTQGENKENSPLPKQKVKRVRKVGVFSIFFLILLLLLVLTITPFYSLMYSYLPRDAKIFITKNLYQRQVIKAGTETLDKPKKYTPAEPLQVLGDNTGLCFSFPSTSAKPNAQFINKGRLDGAKRGEKIAEIIVVGNNKYEYELNTVIINEDHEKSENPHATICQTFGREYGIIPQIINVIYIRPLREFTATEVFWATTKDIHLD